MQNDVLMYRMQLEKDLYENPDNTTYQLCNTPEAMESDSDVCLDMESDDLYTKSPCTSQNGRDLCENADKYGDLDPESPCTSQNGRDVPADNALLETTSVGSAMRESHNCSTSSSKKGDSSCSSPLSKNQRPSSDSRCSSPVCMAQERTVEDLRPLSDREWDSLRQKIKNIIGSRQEQLNILLSSEDTMLRK